MTDPRPAPAPRPRPVLGFALVDLIVTLVLMVTLAGAASLYYGDVKDFQKETLVVNQLDELALASQAWELSRQRSLNQTDVVDAALSYSVVIGVLRLPPNVGTLHYLLKDGRIRDIGQDPWRNDFLVDATQGVVFSMGPDRVANTPDDRIKVFRKAQGIQSGTAGDALQDCKAPPVIASFGPTGVIRDAKPRIRGTYFASDGCIIDAAKTRLLVNQEEVTSGMQKGGGQVTYTPPAALADGVYEVVLLVRDEAGHSTEETWIFTVDTETPVVAITEPSTGQAIKGKFSIKGAVLDESIRSWSLTWDFRQLKYGEEAVGSMSALGQPQGAMMYPDFDTLDERNPVSDGRHFITLSLTDKTGLTIDAQNEVVVDNNAPRINITRNHPGAVMEAGRPQVITTSLVNIAGLARDNIFVKDVRFRYVDRTTGQVVSGQSSNGSTAIPRNWDPYDVAFRNNFRAFYNSNLVEFSTVPSKGTTRDWLPAEIYPIRLEPGQYKLEYFAFDLAGNESTLATTEFDINLFSGGISQPQMLDEQAMARSAGNPPFFLEDRILTTRVDQPSTAPHRRGQVRFVLLEGASSSSIATWEVIIDDNGGNSTFSGNGTFVTSGPARDWWATGPLPETTNRPVFAPQDATAAVNPADVGQWYDPDSNANKARRQVGTGASGTGELTQGVYKAKVKYTGPTGQVRTAITTFLIDNQEPLVRPIDGVIPQDVLEFKAFPVSSNVWINFSVDPRLVNSFSDQSTQGNLYFRGKARDFPTSGVIESVSWTVERTASGIQTVVPLRQVFGLSTSSPRSNLVSFPQNSTGMAMTSTSPGALDGRSYRAAVTVRDGAGIETTVRKGFTVNTVGPIIRFFTLENNDPQPLTIDVGTGDAPSLHVLNGRSIQMSFTAVDELPVGQILYNVFNRAANPGLSRQITLPAGVITSYTVDDPPLTVLTDDSGAAFKSLPTTYEISVQGYSNDESGENPDGPLFRTVVGFKFLTNLAIYAPHFNEQAEFESIFQTIASTNTTWLSRTEQQKIADYLFEEVDVANTRRIFNFTGTAVPGQIAGDLTNTRLNNIRDWMSESTSNGTTDVLVVLDAFPSQIFPGITAGDTAVKRFLESRTDLIDPARAAATRDGDVIVWVGPLPFSFIIQNNGVRAVPQGVLANSGQGQISVFGDLIFDLFTPAPDPLQLLTPGATYSAYIPSLFPYDPTQSFLPFPGGPAERVLKNRIFQLGQVAGTDWSLERLFSVDSGLIGNLSSGTGVGGNCMMFRQQSSRGIFASFLSFGPAGPTNEETAQAGSREAPPNLGPVIEEFLEGFVLNPGSAREASKRVYFNTDPNLALEGNGAAAGKDLIYWPSDTETFVNVTRIDGSARQDSVLAGVSAARNAIFLSPSQVSLDPDFLSAPSHSLYTYFFETIDLQQKVKSAPIDQADLADNATALVFRTRANLSGTADGTSALAGPVLYFKRIGVAPQPYTTSTGVATTHAANPRIEPSGRFTVFDSQNIYSTSTFPGNNFADLKQTSFRQIYRHDGLGVGAQIFPDSGVTVDPFTTPNPTPRIGASSKNTRPVSMSGGRLIAFETQDARLPGQSTDNPRSQIALAFLLTPGSGNWKIGLLTSATEGNSGNLDMTGDLVNEVSTTVYPYIVFESEVNYLGSFPFVDISTGQPDDVTPSALDQVKGARANTTTPLHPTHPTEGRPLKGIYLFGASTSRQLFRLALGDTDDCLNPRISPDGSEVVFESRAANVRGAIFYDGVTYTTHTVNNPAAPANVVYRIKLRGFDTPEQKRYAIIQRISPPGIDLGSEARPMVSN